MNTRASLTRADNSILQQQFVCNKKKKGKQNKTKQYKKTRPNVCNYFKIFAKRDKKNNKEHKRMSF